MSTYNEVTPRVSLEKPSSSIDYKNSANWPKDLKNFVNRMFSKANKLKFSTKQKNKLQEELKGTISLAISQNAILENNWENQDLPCFNDKMDKLQLACNLVNGTSQQGNGTKSNSKKKENGTLKNEGKNAKTKTKIGLTTSKLSDVRPKNILHDDNDSSGDNSDDYDPEREFEKSSLTSKKKTNASKPSISIGSLPPLKKMKKVAVPPKETPEVTKKQQKPLKVSKSGVLMKPSSSLEPVNTKEINNSSNHYNLIDDDDDNDYYTPSLPESSVTISKPKFTVNQLGNNTNLSDAERLKMRGSRFERELSAPLLSANDDLLSNDRHLDKPLIGTCQKLEKSYLRLTSQPNPEMVRPLPVMKKTLNFLIEKYLSGATYPYLCDQFKSLRQDLTVQHIKNEFTILVYEYHCRLAIEFNDLGEFNQCQSQLKLLYDDNSLSKLINSNDQMLSNKYEFMSYRVLYYIITNNIWEAFDLRLKLIENGIETNNNEFLRVSYQLLEYNVNHDYFNFFKTIKKFKELDLLDKEKKIFDKKSRFFFLKLLTPILVKERMNALSIIAKTYRLISTSFLKEQLFFKFDDAKEEDSNFSSFIDTYKLNDFITTDSNGLIFYEGHKSKLVVDSIRQKMFGKIDIKGQI